ncbi:IS1380 family transposase ISSp1 [Sphingomonas sp. S2M10]|uniref:IS1380 family transposase n=1 Tax=Sphingomonas TaxID=13687 RepID=UPI0014572FF1|nr:MULTISPECIES: IS1380 family transposase [Sphingomonas]MDF0489004.1 IS1380 family transposase [Sphingomonas pollutisoli]NLS25102.1 IS1380 family transposase ISSp1 [Sphingomonas sp. S2M10]
MPRTTPAGSDDSAPGFSFPAVGGKKITAEFDGGRLTSDGGVLLLAQAERAMGICRRLAACIADPRDPTRVTHRLDDILRARVFAITCGYEDADDLDALRDDPGFRLALGKLPGSGAGLASQPTMSRWENAPTTRELARMMAAMIGVYCASYPVPPAAVTLDIDDTCDVVHGYQQLSFWNGHHGERCFLPIHVYDTATGRPVAMLLRTGKTPSGAEGAGHIRRLVRHIRQHWPDTHITIRGDGHYGRPEIMAFCEAAGVDYVFGLPTNAALRADPIIVAVADACAVKRAQRQCPVLRHYTETRYGAQSWKGQRRVVARIEASTLGMDIRYVVTSLTEGSAEHIYGTLYCARGQAENLIKRHKTQLASDRTSCRSANANQMRLILHTAAYWLMWRIQQAIPKATALAAAEFATLRLRLLKVAARVIESASRIRVAFASACPDAGVFKAIATGLRPAPT